MLLVEVGGNHQQALGMELVEGVIEERCPEPRTIPEILMAEEGEVRGLRDFSQERELGCVES